MLSGKYNKFLVLVILFSLFLNGCTGDIDTNSNYVNKITPAVQVEEKTFDNLPDSPTLQEVDDVIKFSQEDISENKLSNDNYYINSQGNKVHSPAYADIVPAGASAKCRDGTYSFSQSRRGTCSHHGGVAEWL